MGLPAGLPAGRVLGNRGHRGQRLVDGGQQVMVLPPAVGQDLVIRARHCPSGGCHHPLGDDGTPWPQRGQAEQLLNELHTYQYEWSVATFGRFPLTQHILSHPVRTQQNVKICVCVCVCVCVCGAGRRVAARRVMARDGARDPQLLLFVVCSAVADLGPGASAISHAQLFWKLFVSGRQHDGKPSAWPSA